MVVLPEIGDAGDAEVVKAGGETDRMDAPSEKGISQDVHSTCSCFSRQNWKPRWRRMERGEPSQPSASDLLGWNRSRAQHVSWQDSCVACALACPCWQHRRSDCALE